MWLSSRVMTFVWRNRRDWGISFHLFGLFVGTAYFRGHWAVRFRDYDLEV